MEVPASQRHASTNYASDGGLLTDLAPDPLDRYPSVEAYYADKRLLFRNARADHLWVLNADEPPVLELAAGAPGWRALCWLRRPADGWYDGGARRLQLGRDTLLARAELGLLGAHNVAIALAAALAVREAGVTPDVIGTGLRSFRALPHRLEPVREVGGVRWINDSKATNIASTVVAVEAMDRPFVLLLGGRHKGEPYTRLVPLLEDKCRLVIAYGEAGPRAAPGPAPPVPPQPGAPVEVGAGPAPP